MLRYEKPISLAILGQKNMFKKRFISYFKNNEITTLKKHIDGDHYLIARKFEEKVNNNAKSLMELKPTYKEEVYSYCTCEIFKFFGAIYPYQKKNIHQKDFLENLGFFIVKNHYPFSLLRACG
jgi:hypothetical protein